MNKEALPPLSDVATSILIGGIYEHYKGMIYQVIGVARHSESLEEMVVYQAQYGDKGLWVRPLGMFTENILIDGFWVPRFKLLFDK